MSYSVSARVRVQKDVVTRITRVLKGKGQLNVKVGQEVAPDEILGNGTTSPGFRTLNIAQLLGESPASAEKYLMRKIGQRIYKGELLAQKKGWLLSGEKIITSPSDGVLDFFNNKTGELKISFFPKSTDLPAGVYGVVENVDLERGQVVIRTLVTRVFGVFGSGRMRDGILHILSKKDDLISVDKIRAEYTEQILVGGSLFYKETISAVVSAGINGIITGGMNAADYKGMASGRLVFPRKLDNDIGISVVVCEGFGSVPIGEDIFKNLSDYEGKFVFIDGNKGLISLPSFSSSSMAKIKNTILPPMQTAKITDQNWGIIGLEIGQQVRIVGDAYLGEQGKVKLINGTPTLLPSGINTYLATVETARRKIQVPVANLEVIL